ncbi:hypothetical protein WJX73_007709 [Symbiochloris irregularis]|uniref:Nucleoside diphosphate kinase-like domain-containing protein n=1 Tax=Symbiochloris irregularis TaxID=706552 RepID=A0AAW1NTX7_9CHLO
MALQLNSGGATLALIKPDAFGAGHANDIVQLTLKAGFTVHSQRTMQLTPELAEEFYAEHKGKHFFPILVDFMTSGPLCAMKLGKPGAVKAWRDLIGPTNSNVARDTKPESIRAMYGTDGTKNATHGSANDGDASRELDFFFPDPAATPTGKQAAADAAAFKACLQSQLQPALAQGLAALCQQHQKQGALPDYPVSWLGKWLLTNDPAKFNAPKVEGSAPTSAAKSSAGDSSARTSAGAVRASQVTAVPGTRVSQADLGDIPVADLEGVAAADEPAIKAAGAGDDNLSVTTNQAFEDADDAAPGVPLKFDATLEGYRSSPPTHRSNPRSARPSQAGGGSGLSAAALSPPLDAVQQAAVAEPEAEPTADASAVEGELTEGAAEEEEDSIEPPPGAPIPSDKPAKTVLFVEGQHMEVQPNNGDIQDPEDDEYSPIKRQPTAFVHATPALENQDEEEYTDEESDTQSAPANVGEAQQEPAAEAAAAEPAAAVEAEASEWTEGGTEYTEGETEYTDEEEEEEPQPETGASAPAAE